MGNRLLVFILVLMAIQGVLLIYDKTEVDSASAPWLFFKNPSDWSTTIFITFLSGSLLTISAAAYVGSIIFNNERLEFASSVLALISFGAPIYSLWNVINREVGYFGDANWFIASIIVSPLAIMYVWYCIGWYRNSSEI